MAAPQDDEVAKQAARITTKDPAASLDAISRLVDLAGKSKADVEAAAAKIPDEAAFYRQALLSELKSRGALGDKFGREIRVSIDFKEKSVADALAELGEKTKEKVDATYAMRGAPANPITVKADEVPYLQALAQVCREAKYWMNPTPDGIAVYQGGRDVLGMSVYRNFLVMIQSGERSSRTLFGAGTKRSLSLRIVGMWDSQAGVILAREPKLETAVDDKGRALEAMPRGDDEEDPYRAAGTVDNGVHGGSYGELRFKLPEKDAEKVGLVRGTIAFLVPVKSGALTLSFKDGKAEPASDEVAELSLVQMEGQQQQWAGRGGIFIRNQELKIRVKPKGSLEDLKKMPVAFTVKIKDQGELKASGYGQVVDGAIEYQIWPQFPMAQRLNQEDNGHAYESVTVTVHREVVERPVPFEFRDVPLK
jgi:hypothetical protein